jgi:serine/threonine protein kinase
MSKNLISQGATAEVFDIGNNQVLKLFKKDYPVYAIENEIQITNQIQDHYLPIPKFFGKVEQEGRTGLVFENIQGLTMGSIMALKPWSFFSYAKQMAEIHSIIHKTKIEGILQQKVQLEFCINQSNELPDNIKEKIIHKLKKLNDGNCLCHGDFYPDNILYASKANPIVIDWMCAAVGNPAGDVATTIVLLKYAKAPSYYPLMKKIFIYLFTKTIYRIYIKHYIKITGMNRHEIHEWELPIAAARLFVVPNGKKAALIKFINKELKALIPGAVSQSQ